MDSESAKRILEMKFPDVAIARMNKLAAKARAGMLTPDEEEEIDAYREVGHLLERLKSEARQSLEDEE